MFNHLDGAAAGGEADRLRDIVKWCLTQIAYYKVPGFVASVSQLPLTATQKIQRSELKSLAARLSDIIVELP